MDQLMRLQVALSDKLFTTVFVGTDKRSLTCVNPQMRLEIASLLEFSETINEWTEE